MGWDHRRVGPHTLNFIILKGRPHSPTRICTKKTPPNLHTFAAQTNKKIGRLIVNPNSDSKISLVLKNKLSFP